MYKLRPYQSEAVSKTIKHFQNQKTPGVVVLPTGAGKSLVIAELAKIARGRVLVLAHVKELVEQNHGKYESYNLKAGIYSAGLNRKDNDNKVIFGSIQSVARASDDFFKDFTLLVIDECHRVSMDNDTQYLQVIQKLKNDNNEICILGLTATPYRLGMGWIYQFNSRGILRTKEDRFFKKCIYDLSLRYMINNNFLTPPIQIDSPVACFDFSSLKIKNNSFSQKDIEGLLQDQERVTPGIIENIIDMAVERKGVMIFTSTVKHAKEILSYLPSEESELVIGDTSLDLRDEIIDKFKKEKIKFLVNVSVLTTGFDAPHVDLIAILRPTESVSLYQQIVGRGLRLNEGKEDCLVLDYTGVGHDIFSPEIGEDKPSEDTTPVKITCPDCGYVNDFWGRVDEFGEIEEHFGRVCKGANENPVSFEINTCGFRFRYKLCDECGSQNDIAARECVSCQHVLVDNDTKLKSAMALKDAHIMRPEEMLLKKGYDKNGNERLEVEYYDVDAENLKEYFYINNEIDVKSFFYNFIRMHNKTPEVRIDISCVDEVIDLRKKFRIPMYVIARKQKFYWKIREKIFE